MSPRPVFPAVDGWRLIGDDPLAADEALGRLGSLVVGDQLRSALNEQMDVLRAGLNVPIAAGDSSLRSRVATLRRPAISPPTQGSRRSPVVPARPSEENADHSEGTAD